MNGPLSTVITPYGVYNSKFDEQTKKGATIRQVSQQSAYSPNLKRSLNPNSSKALNFTQLDPNTIFEHVNTNFNKISEELLNSLGAVSQNSNIASYNSFTNREKATSVANNSTQQRPNTSLQNNNVKLIKKI